MIATSFEITSPRKRAVKEIKYMLYNHNRIDELIDKRKTELIDGMKYYISKARSYGYKVYLGTLLPIEGWRTYADFREKLRNEFNDWMRTTDLVDGCIDFDKALFYLDESHTDRARHISEGGTPSLLRSILFAFLILAIGGCLFLLMPEILTWINNLLAA